MKKITIKFENSKTNTVEFITGKLINIETINFPHPVGSIYNNTDSTKLYTIETEDGMRYSVIEAFVVKGKTK